MAEKVALAISQPFTAAAMLLIEHEEAEDDENMPCQVAIEPVRSVSAGCFHTGAITRQGSLITWGDNYEGQLGHGDTTDRSIPTAVASIAHLTLKQVTAGGTCTLVVDAAGSILTTGRMRPGAPSSNTFNRIQFPDPGSATFALRPSVVH